MIDLLTIFDGRYFQTETGTYYEQYPDSLDVEGIPFDYEHIDPQEKRDQMIFANVSNNNGYIALQDGTFYSIESVSKDYNSAPKEAFRLLADVTGVEYVIRLVSQANPFNLR